MVGTHRRIFECDVDQTAVFVVRRVQHAAKRVRATPRHVAFVALSLSLQLLARVLYLLVGYYHTGST